MSLDGRTLTIAAEHREEAERQEPGNGGKGGRDRPRRDYLLREREFRRFRRSFTLPTGVDDQSVRARCEDGVLEITLDKSPESKPRKIELQ